MTETGPGVPGLAAGDRVLGLAEGGFGPVAVADARLLARIPDGWSFAQAASVPVAFATAWYGLADLAGARAGQRLLVHAGPAAWGWPRWRSPGTWAWRCTPRPAPAKHATLAAMGLDAAHIASSRDAGFERAVPGRHGGAGVDIVLNSLAGELTDASLRLLPRRRDVHRDGQDRRPRPGAGRRGSSGRAGTGPSTWRGGPGPARADPRPGDGAAGGRGAGAAAGAGLGRAPGAGGVPVHEPGPAHRQARADHPARPGRPAGGRDGADHRRDRDAGRPGGPAPGAAPGGPGGWCWPAGPARPRPAPPRWPRTWPGAAPRVQVAACDAADRGGAGRAAGPVSGRPAR